MSEAGRVILAVIAILVQVLFLIIGVISYSDSRKIMDKIRFTFLTLGSLFTLIFVINEVFEYV